MTVIVLSDYFGYFILQTIVNLIGELTTSDINKDVLFLYLFFLKDFMILSGLIINPIQKIFLKKD